MPSGAIGVPGVSRSAAYVDNRYWLMSASSLGAGRSRALKRRGRPSAGVLARLRRARIVCSANGDRLRVFLAPYIDEDDIAALATALAWGGPMIAKPSSRPTPGTRARRMGSEPVV